MYPHLNIHNSSARSHPLEEENRTFRAPISSVPVVTKDHSFLIQWFCRRKVKSARRKRWKHSSLMPFEINSRQLHIAAENEL
jgi:hypothetical protein